jgi:hypothetical protein
VTDTIARVLKATRESTDLARVRDEFEHRLQRAVADPNELLDLIQFLMTEYEPAVVEAIVGAVYGPRPTNE